jgi:hypothetical protein
MRDPSTQRGARAFAPGVPLLLAGLRPLLALAGAVLAFLGGWLIAGRNLLVWLAMVFALLWAVAAVTGFYLLYRVLRDAAAAVYCRALLFAARRVP